ncbi:YciI family protein [Varibaculum prostatecancerukia]|uniref:YciI family protein n=1 Tax=Varibaculum prostatecancerukia TaxID=2811781 RepID=UPI001C002FA2|nr:YciI family protein [Varibaculum prostatecancerukia]
MALFAVEYFYDPAAAEKMNEVRPDHRVHLRGLHAQGIVKLVGSWVDDPHPGALIAVEAESAEDALTALAEDPFFLAGFITDRKVHQWNVIIGEIA